MLINVKGNLLLRIFLIYFYRPPTKKSLHIISEICQNMFVMVTNRKALQVMIFLATLNSKYDVERYFLTRRGHQRLTRCNVSLPIGHSSGNSIPDLMPDFSLPDDGLKPL